MFNKKSCPKCGTKVSSNYDFCPKCGKNISSKKESLDYFGMFGKDDFFENERKSDFEPEIKLPFGFNTIFNHSGFTTVWERALRGAKARP